MFYPNPFDFDRSGDLGFPEQAFQNEFLSDGLAEVRDEDEKYDINEWGCDDE